MINNFALMFFAFAFLWIGSGLAVSAVNKIAHSIKASSFLVSFFILGLFTSITEIMVGVNAFLEKRSEIYVGNLVGSSIVVFLLVIPLLAVIGNGVRLNHSFKFKDLVSALVVVGFPALLTLDNKIGIIDSLICIIMYGYFVFMLDGENGGLVEKVLSIDVSRGTVIKNFFKMFIAIILVFSGSRILVDQTPILGEYLNISPFIISILLVSLGTNIPELSIAIRSIASNNKEIAFGNYVGSASLNTLEIGILSFFDKHPVSAIGSNFSVITFLIGLVFFGYFVKSKNDISRNEGTILLFAYIIFIISELLTGPGWNII